MAKPRTPDPNLGTFWRVVLAVAAVALIGGGLALWWHPPMKTTFAPQATTVSKATTDVQDRSEVVSGLLIGIGGLFGLIAANGRKLASLKIGNEEATFAIATAAAKKADKKAAKKGLSVERRDDASAIAAGDALATLRYPSRALDLDQIAEKAVSEVEGAG
jgi:hypothetical protein